MGFTKVSLLKSFQKTYDWEILEIQKVFPAFNFPLRIVSNPSLQKSISASYILAGNCKDIGFILLPALWKPNHFEQQRMFVMEHFKILPGPGTAEMFSRNGIYLNLTRRRTLRQRCRDAMASVGGVRGKEKTGSRTRSYFPLAGFRTIIWHP